MVYPKSRALWSKQRITSSVVVSGTEFVENTEFILPITADDVSDPDKGVPNQTSPYGVSINCDDNSGVITDDIVHSILDPNNFAVSSLRKDTWYTLRFSGAHGQPILDGSTFTVASNSPELVIDTGPNDSFRISDLQPLTDNSGFKIILNTTHAGGGITQPELFFYID